MLALPPDTVVTRTIPLNRSFSILFGTTVRTRPVAVYRNVPGVKTPCSGLCGANSMLRARFARHSRPRPVLDARPNAKPPPLDGGVIAARLTPISVGRESAVRGPRPRRKPSATAAQPPSGRQRWVSDVSGRPADPSGRWPKRVRTAALHRRGGPVALLNRERNGTRNTYLVSRSTVITEAVPLGRDRSIAHRDGWPLRVFQIGISRARNFW